MRSKLYILVFIITFLFHCPNNAQEGENCFLIDFKPDTAEIPQFVETEIPSAPVTSIVTLVGDTLAKVSDYMFGNAIAAWAGAHDNPVLVEGVKNLAPSLIRFPGGSWSNGYFWNGLPADLPDSIYDGTTYNADTKTASKSKFWGQTGVGGWQTTTAQYYKLRQNTEVNEGLITVNYGYARYGTSADPVTTAAKYAADWVRYDNGRTKFWEIGNENAGPWEYGWMIDTALNKDGQPQIITGELYGKHFKVFADSMRAAAAEIGAEIYIGGQIVIDGENSWNFVDRTWNADFFREVGDTADFYIIHDYFENSGSVNKMLTNAGNKVIFDRDFIDQDIVEKGAFEKPIALTEYNMSPGNDEAAVSYVNGMQAVILMSELIENNFGLSARWLIISGATTLFYGGDDQDFLHHPHAEFYYLTYMPKFYGDHAISTTSTHKDILSYASKFSSGETGLIVVNKGDNDQVVTLSTETVGVGDAYYIYSFTGGEGEFSQDVYINNIGPDAYHWGPYNELFDIAADAYPIDGRITFSSPAYSVQMILIEGGENLFQVDESVLGVDNNMLSSSFILQQNQPNPFNLLTSITYQLPEHTQVNLKVYDYMGKEIAVLVSKEQDEGEYQVRFDAADLPDGIYFYALETDKFRDVKKLVVRK